MKLKRSKKTRAKNKLEREYEQIVASRRCCVTGRFPVQVHHIAGASARSYAGLERVHIGYLYIIPLHPETHKDLHTNKTAFVEKYGITEKQLFLSEVSGNSDHDFIDEKTKMAIEAY